MNKTFQQLEVDQIIPGMYCNNSMYMSIKVESTYICKRDRGSIFGTAVSIAVLCYRLAKVIFTLNIGASTGVGGIGGGYI